MILLLALVMFPLDINRVAVSAASIGGRGGNNNNNGGIVNLSSIASSILSSGKNLSSPVFNNSSGSSSFPPSMPSSSLAQHKSTTSSFISSVPTPPRGGGASLTLKKKSKKAKKKPFQPVIGGEECFLPINSIAALTLSDVATAFRFAMESNRPTSRHGKKILECEKTERTLKMMRAMEDAACKSRGEGVLPATTYPLDNDSLFSSNAFNHDYHDHRRHHHKRKKNNSYDHLSSNGGFGDVDALQFCAAMRIFAEWRLIRQVPDGYRSYAVGMEIGHKDVVQNVGKIEEAVHEWIQLRREEAEEAAEENEELEHSRKNRREKKEVMIRGPTLRQLLHHELTTQTHGSKLPKLVDPSAAMALLWSRRQLQYQTSIFSNVMAIPHVFKDARHAVSEAYSEVYEHLHGWAIQKVFQVSFRAAPDAGLIFRHMNPEKLERVKHKVKRGEVEHHSLEVEEEEEVEDDENEDEETVEEIVETETKQKRSKEEKEQTKEMPKSQIIEKKKKKAKGETEEIEITEIHQQSGKKLKLLRSFGKHGVVRKIFRRKSKDNSDTASNIVQPSKISSLRRKLRVPFTGTVKSHVPSTETIRVSKTKRLIGGIRRAFSFSSSSKSATASSVAAVTPKKLERSNRVRGGAKKVQQEQDLEEEIKLAKIQQKEAKDKAKEDRREQKRKQKQKKKMKTKQINLSHDALEEYVTKQMELDARERIKVYLHVAKPLLNDLEGLFHEMNMEDPSTV